MTTIVTIILSTINGEVKNKIRNATDFVKKTDYDAKISEVEKIILLHLVIKHLSVTYLIQRLRNLIFLISYKILKRPRLLTKTELKAEQDKIVKIETFDSCCVRNMNRSIDTLKGLVIANVVQHGNKKDSLVRVLNLL